MYSVANFSRYYKFASIIIRLFFLNNVSLNWQSCVYEKSPRAVAVRTKLDDERVHGGTGKRVHIKYVRRKLYSYTFISNFVKMYPQITQLDVH